MSKQKKYRSRDYHGYWETIKTLPTLQAKWEYTWENWNVQILSVAFIIVFVSSVAISNYRNNIPVYLHGAFVNILTVDQAEDQSDYLDQAFLHDYLGLPEDENITMSYSSNMLLDLSGNTEISESSYNTIAKLDANIPSNEIDYFLMTDNVVTWIHGRYGEAFLDLREFLTEEEMVLYGDRLRYTQENVPIAIDVSDSKILANMNMVADAPVCFSWFAYVEDVDHMRPFFEFLMRTLS